MKNISIELYDNQILEKGIDSILDFYRTLSIDNRQFSENIAFVTGVDSPFLNVLFDFRTERKNSKKLIEAASEYFNQFNVPWGWFITPASFDNDLEDMRCLLIEESPAMYFNLLNSFPDFNNKNITIHEVYNQDDLNSWIEPINDGFQGEEGDDSYLKLNLNLLQKGEKKLRHFIAFYDGTLAAASTLFLSNDSVMLHNLATKNNFKKLGLGTALTLYMMKEAKLQGFKHCFLDSSDEAFNLYKKLGFKVYCATLIYCKNHEKN